MPSRLFVRHHGLPPLGGVQVGLGGVQEALFFRPHQPRNQPLPQNPALGITAIRVEAVPDYGLPVAPNIGVDGHRRNRHLGKADVSVAEFGADGNHNIVNRSDLHRRCRSVTQTPWA